MKIPFQNVGQQPKHVTVALKEEGFDITLEGSLSKKRQDRVELEATVKGTIELECDMCAESYTSHIDEKVTFTLTDRPYRAADDNGEEQDYDIIEFLDGIIDLNEIILSEVNAIKYDYHKCTNCN